MVDIKRMPGRERLDEIPTTDFMPEQRPAVAIWGLVFLAGALALAVVGWSGLTASYATLVWVGFATLLVMGLVALFSSFVNHPV